MTPSFLLLGPALASSFGLPVLAAAPLDLGTTVQQVAGQFAAETGAVLASINSAVIDVVRVAYVTFLLLGVLLHFSHLAKRLGKDLVVGGVVLFVLTEYLIPAVSTLAK